MPIASLRRGGGIILRVSRANATNPNLDLKVRGPETFISNRAGATENRALLERPFVSRFPSQPEVFPWHPAYSLESSRQGPPRYRQFIRQIDAVFARLHLELARQDAATQRLMKRLLDEDIFERKFFARRDLETWLARHAWMVQIFWEKIQDRHVMRQETLERSEALRTHLALIEKIATHEGRRTDLYTDRIFAQTRSSREQGSRPMFTTPENGIVVTLPSAGRDMQGILENIFQDPMHQGWAQSVAWNPSHSDMTRKNGVMIRVPRLDRPMDAGPAPMTEEVDRQRRTAALRQLVVSAHEEKKKYQDKARIIALKKTHDLQKTRGAMASKEQQVPGGSTLPDIEKKIHEQAHERSDEARRRAHQDARLSLPKVNVFKSPKAERDPTEEALPQDEGKGQQAYLSLSQDEKMRSLPPAVQRELAGREAPKQGTSALSPPFDRPARSFEELERSLTKVLEMDQQRKEKVAVKDMQRNLALQAAGAESLLMQHAGREAVSGAPILSIPERKKN